MSALCGAIGTGRTTVLVPGPRSAETRESGISTASDGDMGPVSMASDSGEYSGYHVGVGGVGMLPRGSPFLMLAMMLSSSLSRPSGRAEDISWFVVDSMFLPEEICSV